ncbi:MAG TPA: DUF4230 domain-containing protein [Haliscomenobacter sp.]|uniref:DUF4230 domain-containing protein n=1 Tax=Haliscomenobacter sp. TaxID=2717303 RepID=UPI002BA69BB2|nr:DUF4230 domain-containing protein [Haliscomenobacter sp.]HOY16825.1 DUF4230 domain-containing protein [Haliscomenobacter sp.]HPH19766.1 DUF4230 domain-containing protein [Haliscomenobacter sp.]
MRRLLLVLGFIAVFIGGFWIARSVFMPRERVVTQAEASVLLEKMKTVAKLVTVEGYFSELYNHKDYWRYDWWIFRKKALLRVKAKVSVGFDLEGLDIKADTATKTITIKNIPKEPEIISIDHDIDYYDISEGSFNTFTPEDYNKINKKARDLIEQKAKESDLIKQAREQGIEIIDLIRFIGESSGWIVQMDSVGTKSAVKN